MEVTGIRCLSRQRFILSAATYPQYESILRRRCEEFATLSSQSNTSSSSQMFSKIIISVCTLLCILQSAGAFRHACSARTSSVRLSMAEGGKEKNSMMDILSGKKDASSLWASAEHLKLSVRFTVLRSSVFVRLLMK